MILDDRVLQPAVCASASDGGWRWIRDVRPKEGR